MTSTIQLIRKWKFHPSKRMGQNFLSDPNAAEMIIRRSGISSEDIVLEIGPGLGAMTIPAAGIAKKVYAVEKDKRIVPILTEELLRKGITNASVIVKNILDFDINELSKKENRDIIIIGNLPYNISSQILVKLLHSRSIIRYAVLMFQKELAERIAAEPGGRDYGRLSVMLRYCAEIETLSNVKAAQFYPKPGVDSTILKIVFRREYENRADDEEFLFSVIKAAFSKRRKTLKNSLAGNWPLVDAKRAGEFLSDSGIDPSRRAETLSVSEFVKLCNVANKAIVSPEGKTT
jgi:16S rRNA (adenine1518-N6/adenine1519-N6)-dimethyltransferase